MYAGNICYWFKSRYSHMFEDVKKFNNRILNNKEIKELNASIKMLPPDVEVVTWQWYKHTRIALIKDGYQV